MLISTHRLPRLILLWMVVLILVGANLPRTFAGQDSVSGDETLQEDQPMAVSPPAALPTDIPPTDLPPTAEPTALPTLQPVVPPTSEPTQADPATEPPTAAPSPTSGQPSASSDQTPTAEPVPAELSPNADALVSRSGPGPFPLAPAATQTVSFTYLVTTDRTATTVHAELRQADGSLATGWWLEGQAGGSAWSSNGGAIDVTETAAQLPGTSFAVTLVVTAPADVVIEQGVTLSLRSIATSGLGDEPAVSDQAVGTFTSSPPVSAGPAGEPSTMLLVESGNLACTQTLPPGSDIINVGEVAEFTCSHGPGPLRLRVNSLTVGWEYRLGDGPWSTASGAAAVTPASGSGGQQVNYRIQMRVAGTGAGVPPGSSGQATVEFISPAGTSLTPAAIATLGVTRATGSVPTADDLGMTCGPDPIVASGAGDAVAATCTVTGEESLGDRTVTLTGIDVSAPLGWTVTSDETVTGSTLTYSITQVIAAGTEYSITFSLTPESCETTSGTVVISSTFTHGDAASTDGPTASLMAHLSGSIGIPVVSSGRALDFGTSEWTANGYAPVRGSLALTFSGPAGGACPGTQDTWSIQISMDGLFREDTNEQIPANAITYLGSQSNLGVPNGLDPAGADIPLAAGTAITIATGNGPMGAAVWSPVFQLDPPNSAPAGNYRGTIRIEMVNAP